MFKFQEELQKVKESFKEELEKVKKQKELEKEFSKLQEELPAALRAVAESFRKAEFPLYTADGEFTPWVGIIAKVDEEIERVNEKFSRKFQLISNILLQVEKPGPLNVHYALERTAKAIERDNQNLEIQLVVMHPPKLSPKPGLRRNIKKLNKIILKDLPEEPKKKSDPRGTDELPSYKPENDKAAF